MLGFRAKCRAAAVVVFSAWVAIAALYGLLKPISSGCIMTYMYPTYIPISEPANVSPDKYGLFLYHEGWKKIDFKEHVKKLMGVPVLFIPGNGGSYKQVRSIAAESARAFQGGPLEPAFYHESSLAGDWLREDTYDILMPNQYSHMLDWFAVDLEGEHSAMDGRILEEHTEYVVNAIHRILDQYKDSWEARSKEGAEVSGSLPTSVILVGHSMGGFVARAAIVHPQLRKSSVETVLTLASPHLSPPVALQPSLGHFFSSVNREWRKGYEIQITDSGRRVSVPKLSRVVVVSISGGVNDYQVRSKLASLDGIVPSSHGFMISSSGTNNVWLSMDHQSILWCNQLVVQLSHTLLSLINPKTGKPFSSTGKRVLIFRKMLDSGIPQSFNWTGRMQAPFLSRHVPRKAVKDTSGSKKSYLSCPPSVYWSDDGLEKDLYIQTHTVTVLAMDGRRRWLDIRKLGSKGKDHFIFVTNLAPCSGVRIHLWPEKINVLTKENVAASNRILEVTLKMVHIPAGPAPRQIEPGSQTEQAPPSGVLHLSPKDMHGFRFLTISVAPRPSISGRPPPAASMAVGQFYNPKEGEREFSPQRILRSVYGQEEVIVKEDHPMALNLSFSISLGLLPVTFSVSTVGCGIKNSELPVEEAGDTEHSSLCKLRCFPPAALAWDSLSDLQIVPNLFSEMIVVDSSPAFWSSSPGSDKTTFLLLVDPHCSYKINFAVSLTATASRFVLLYSSKIIGFLIAVIFFALMRQARAWELDFSLPSIVTAVEFNLRMPHPFLFLGLVPVLVSLVLSMLTEKPFPPIMSFITVSTICYIIANGCVVVLILSTQMALYVAANLHVYIKIRWQAWEENLCFTFLHRILNISSILYTFKVVRILKGNPNLVVAFVTVPVVCFVHPALGLLVLLLFHAYHCHAALCSFLAASFRSHAQRNDFYDLKTKTNSSVPSEAQSADAFNQLLPLDENHSNSPGSAKSFADIQLEIFNYRHGLLLLHLVAALMFVPSLVAGLERIGMSQRFPWFIDSALCVGIIFHGLCGWKPDIDPLGFSLPTAHGRDVGLSLVYLLSGYYCYICALASAPYRAFYAFAAVGAITFASRIIDRRREKSDSYFTNSRKHSHKH